MLTDTFTSAGAELSAQSNVIDNRRIRHLFVQVFAVVYATAFISFWMQSMGLIGTDGIMPLNTSMAQFTGDGISDQLPSFIDYPTVFRWIGPSDFAIHAVCALGTILSICLLFGAYTRLCIALLWLLYLSLFTVSRPFLGYQWDILLLEVSVLALLIAPVEISSRKALDRWSGRVSTWVTRLVLFKVILSSGLVKLNSLDPTWQNLTALDFHFWTQPIPHQLAWSIHHLGDHTRQLGVWLNHFIELAVPWLILCSLSRKMTLVWLMLVVPIMLAYAGEYSLSMVSVIAGITLLLWCVERCLKVPSIRCTWGRRAAGLSIIVFMVLVASSGNYGFFNLLTINIALLCFTDLDLRLFPSGAVAQEATARPNASHTVWLTLVLLAAGSLITLNTLKITTLFGHNTSKEIKTTTSSTDRSQYGVWSWVHSASRQYQKHLGTLALVNGYGLFARMTTTRYELSVEGSMDGRKWTPYRFKYKPDSEQDLHFAGLHMPRLDWQMWFAALYPKCSRRWLFHFMDALFQGSDSVSNLLEHNPFDSQPPIYLRIQKVRTRFADVNTHASNDAYWAFESVPEPYCPVIERATLEKSKLTRSVGNQR